MTEENWEVAKACDPRAPVEENIEVKEILSGIWSINGEYNVIEGECPVSGRGAVMRLLILMPGLSKCDPGRIWPARYRRDHPSQTAFCGGVAVGGGIEI